VNFEQACDFGRRLAPKMAGKASRGIVGEITKKVRSP
jgi:hypothetical protein